MALIMTEIIIGLVAAGFLILGFLGARQSRRDQIRLIHQRAAFDETCLRERGRILAGQYRHYCPDWDGLTVDETTPEWEGCTCYPVARHN